MATKKEEKEVRELAPWRGGRLTSAFEDMDRLFERFLGRGFGPSWLPRLRWPEEVEMPYPDVDIFESNSDVVLKAELPGIRKEDLEVDVTDDTITISGEKKAEEKVERKDFYRHERSFGSFTRTFALPAGVESAKAKAAFKEGVLEVKVPKKEEAKKKKIPITTQ